MGGGLICGVTQQSNATGKKVTISGLSSPLRRSNSNGDFSDGLVRPLLRKTNSDSGIDNQRGINETMSKLLDSSNMSDMGAYRGLLKHKPNDQENIG